jgi:hypothetical protein
MTYQIPAAYLREPHPVPPFWLSAAVEVSNFLAERVRRGEVTVIGRTAGDRPIRAVAYGERRRGTGTTTYSGACGMRDLRAFYGPDHARTVLMIMGAVHGGEFEGIVGAVNLLAVLETGRDLRGRAWPTLTAAAECIDRLVIVPIVNVDGRERIPLRMEPHMGTANTVHEYFNTGCWLDGTLIGWPDCKRHIPLDFTRTQFPGGYPNDAGVNIQHDDFFGTPQPETRALFHLTAQEKPDIILNMHTGAPPHDYYLRMHLPLLSPEVEPAWAALYRHVHSALAAQGLQGTRDEALEADPSRAPRGVFNLDTALHLHAGALCTVVESPSHGFAGANRRGETVLQTPDAILDAHLVLYQETMVFLAQNGGRCAWSR